MKRPNKSAIAAGSASARGAPGAGAEPDGPAAAPYEPSFPIVGIGASAGGLEACTQLLQALPPNTGMAFVLVQHLSPDRESMLPEILGRATRMRVAHVQDDETVQPNHVYVIPPGVDICVTKGVLELLPRNVVRGQRRPIDQFLRSLAEDQAHCAIGVILSGTASDGTLGLQEVKAEGGLTFAQDDTAQYDSMPRSAVATGCVDFVLPPQGIAQELARISRHPYSAPHPPVGSSNAANERRLMRILQRLSSATGVDFARYKVTTLGRRVSRRMALHKIAGLKEYEQLLSSDPEELDALYEDVLIHVTRFFRDPEVFEALKAVVLPRLHQDRPPQEPLRIWVPGCSSGEEAYSLAITCAEYAEEHGLPVAVQVFASDLSAKMIERARAAVYPQSIAEDVTPQRLSHYFTQDDGGYRVTRAIRDACVFAPHNVMGDPPFSRMDLVSCRNLLIYMEPALQQQILPVLHYALKPGGFLVLGKSETTSAVRDLFQVEDAVHRIYTRKPGSAGRMTTSLFPSLLRSGRPDPDSRSPAHRDADVAAEVQREADRILAARYAPPGVLINSELEILQFWGDTSPYLAPLPGRATLNVLRMARPGLLIPLRSAIQEARSHEGRVRLEGVRAQSEHDARPLNLEVVRLPRGKAPASGFLVLFEGVERGGTRPETHEAAGPRLALDGQSEALEREILRLTQELEGTREYLQAMIEQEQAANEELQSASEEAQSSNEELQSINEELETSKEEIQATNEELTTVNDELQARNEELHRISNDWFNLLESVEVPIIILGRDFRIRRYSPVAGDVLNLIPADVGRPIGDVNFGLAVDLAPVVRQVIESQASQEREVQRHGRWYSLRLRPYRTLDHKIEGAVLVFVDVDTLKRARQYAEAIVATVREPLVVLDEELRVRTANTSYYEFFRTTAELSEGRPLFELDRGQWDLPELRRLLTEVLSDGSSFEDLQVELHCKDFGPGTVQLNARRLPTEPETKPQVLLAIEDITAHRTLEALLNRRVEELAAADRAKNEFVAMLGHELRNPLAPVLFANEMLRRRVGDDPTLERQCALIDRQMRQMGRLLDDLLEGSRASRGMVKLQILPMDLAALVADAVAATSVAFELRRQVVTYVGPEAPLWMQGDPVRLEQVVTNLLNNASKYTEPGGEIRITLEAGRDEAVLRVADTGVGISPELLPRIFELFTQEARSLDRSQGGLGIGLALVQSLVSLHGGSAEAHSEGIGRGSEFIIRLPLATEAELSLETAPLRSETPPLAVSPLLSRPRVLVVDDNRDSADTIVELGEDWGYELRACYDGAAAIGAALEYHPKIVLLDIGLPGMDGYEVARRLRREESLAGIQLVAFTGYGGAADRERSSEAGFDRHLTKPVDPQELRNLFDSLIGAPLE